MIDCTYKLATKLAANTATIARAKPLMPASKVVFGASDPLLGKLLLFEALAMESPRAFRRRHNGPVPGPSRLNSAEAEPPAACSTITIRQISVQALWQMRVKGGAFVLVHVLCPYPTDGLNACKGCLN